MRRVGVNTNVSATRGLAELNQHKRVDLKEGRNGGLSEEEESRNNEDVNSFRPKELGQAHAALHRQHQLPQGPVVQWESFLPLRSLNVLLVENDDSTRHVVTALLRNCGYEVTAVANGVEAWKLLIDLNKQIDLVLTEVVMPYLSGIGLLSKIMSHVTRKNTPVIMMSSDDSMGIVFNCLSKGAVDFLVKPIRKNELKTLWQHVWRKCHSSSGSGSGSGSESGIRDNKSTKSRSIEESDDVSDTSNEDDGANSLWDKEPAHDINSAQVARPETSKLDNNEMGKDLMIGVTKSSSLKTEDKNKKKTDKFCESNMKNVGDKLDISMHIGCENGASRTEPVKAHKEAVKANHLLQNINIEDNYSKESPALELSLKRPRDIEDADVTAQERNVLHHSGLSAFSRYNNVSNDDQTPTGNVDSCSPPGTGSEAAKQNNILSNSNGTHNHRSNGSDDMGSTTNNAFTTKPDDNNPPPNNSTIVVHEHHTSTLQPLIPCASKGDAANTTQQQVEVRHHHHHYHHHHHHVHKRQQQTMMNPDDGSLRNMVSNIFTASAEGDAANYGSASGSNNKSNGETGGSSEKGTGSAPLLQDGKIENNNSGPKTVKGGDGSGSGSGVDQDRVAQREAALVKFRQKRKERCFEKKLQ